MVDGKPEFDFEVEVFPSKLSYKSDYEQMLAEVQKCNDVPGHGISQATYQLGTSLSDKSAQNLEWITLLENILGDLEQALFMSLITLSGDYSEKISTAVLSR